MSKPDPKPHQPRKPKGGKLGKDKSFKKDTQEKRVAKILKDIGVFRTRGSGSVAGNKGDLRGDYRTITIESKTTTKFDSISIKLSYINKITKEARYRRSTPAINFGFEKAVPPVPKDWIAIPADKFKDLIEAAGWDCLDKDLE